MSMGGFSVTRRGLQIGLGLIWLLDGGLQFQSYFYSHGFTGGLGEMAAGQPGWLSDSITWAANLAAQDLGVWNTLFALAQVFIGFGLLWRPTVKPALAASFLWVFGRSPSLLLRGSAAFITAPRAGAIRGRKTGGGIALTQAKALDLPVQRGETPDLALDAAAEQDALPVLKAVAAEFDPGADRPGVVVVASLWLDGGCRRVARRQPGTRAQRGRGARPAQRCLAGPADRGQARGRGHR
jgi:hypothetical protein